MPYDDEARRAARERLQARMERRSQTQQGASAGAPSRQRPARASSPDRASAQTRAEAPDAPRQTARPSRLDASRPSIQVAHRKGGGLRVPAASAVATFAERFSHPAIPLAIAVALALVVAVLVVGRCSAPAAEQQQVPQQNAEAHEQPADSEESAISRETLAGLIGAEEADKLIAQAQQDNDALWIAAHPDAYAPEGPEVQAKMLKLAADEPAALPFVREYPEAYPLDGPVADSPFAMGAESPAPDVPATSIPHYYQWDCRWGNTVYSSASFGLTGCGPTSLAMVSAGLAGSTLSPYDLGEVARERNYMAQYDGTANTFFTDMAGELGMFCEELDVSAQAIEGALSSGKVVIANLGAGYFTQHGHFFVLAGLDSDGRVIVNDPYSQVRSGQTWDAGFIAGESIALYAYSTW